MKKFIICALVILAALAGCDEVAPPDSELSVTLSVRADILLENMHLLDLAKHGLVPDDGFIFAPAGAAFYDGESVFDVLQREMRMAGIHMAFSSPPLYDSAYVMGINNLYERDAGPLSGWVFSVNGVLSTQGASRVILSDGDIIEWIYTLDLLWRDAGGD